MTIDISENNPRIEYGVAAGVVQTVFSVPFDFFEDEDVAVYVDGTLKTLGTDYTLTGGDGSSGTITFVTATPPAVQQVTGASGGSTVIVARHVSLERVTDFVAGQSINRAALNTQLDTIVAQIADLDDKVDRTIHLSDFEVPPSMLLTDDRKGRVLAFDLVTGDVEAGPLSNDIQTIADNITQILAADDEAAAAAASATAAQTAQTAAELAETNAETAETNAAASAVTAASEVTTATTKASEAATSASNAATSESNAASSATASAGSASAAATSATNAAASASSAEASKDAALAALDNFDDRYLGQKASDPATDNDGDPLVSGALYFNTTDEIMKVYEGSLWVAAYASLSGAMFGANNLSDVASASDSRSNLGLGTAATTASTDYATAAQGSLADSATQPSDLAAYATAAQGALADSAVQPNDSPTFGAVTATSFSGDGSALTGVSSVDFVCVSGLTTYTSSTTVTIPAGYSAYINAVGGGGSGGTAGCDDDSDCGVAASGGGAGGSAVKYLADSGSDNTLTLTIGSGGAGGYASDTSTSGNAGGATTVTGTGISISGGGGGGGRGARSTGSGSITAAGATGGVATGGDSNYTGGSTGSVTKSSGSGYNVRAGAMVNGGDIAASSTRLTSAAGTNASVGDSTTSQGAIDFQVQTASLGHYISSGSADSKTATSPAGSSGNGSGGAVARSTDSSTGSRIGRSGDGGDGYVQIAFYREAV